MILRTIRYYNEVRDNYSDHLLDNTVVIAFTDLLGNRKTLANNRRGYPRRSYTSTLTSDLTAEVPASFPATPSRLNA